MISDDNADDDNADDDDIINDELICCRDTMLKLLLSRLLILILRLVEYSCLALIAITSSTHGSDDDG